MPEPPRVLCVPAAKARCARAPVSREQKAPRMRAASVYRAPWEVRAQLEVTVMKGDSIFPGEGQKAAAPCAFLQC